jgi:hypothetical protein
MGQAYNGAIRYGLGDRKPMHGIKVRLKINETAFNYSVQGGGSTDLYF